VVEADLGPVEPGSLRVTGRLRGAGASAEILDGPGSVLPRRDDHSEAAGGDIVLSFEVDGGERVRLAAGPGEDAVLDAAFVRVGRPALLVTVDRYRHECGAPVPVQAILLDAAAAPVADFAGTARASLYGPESASVALDHDGAGNFTGRFAAIGTPGEYVVVATVDGASAALGRIVRRAATPLLASARSAGIVAFEGATPVDGDGNGRADELVLAFRVSVTAPGEYVLQAVFEAAGGPAASLSDVVHAGAVPVSPVMQLRVPAAVIREAGGRPCRLRAIVLMDAGGGTASFHEFPGQSLGAFDPAAFEPLPETGGTFGRAGED
jgi:hypothetical protein